MKIRKKLLIGVSGSALLFIGIGVLSYIASTDFRNQQSQALSEALPAIIALSNAETELSTYLGELIHWTQIPSTSSLIEWGGQTQHASLSLASCLQSVESQLRQHAKNSPGTSSFSRILPLKNDLSELEDIAERIITLKTEDASLALQYQERDHLRATLFRVRGHFTRLLREEYSVVQRQMKSSTVIANELTIMNGALVFSGLGLMYLAAMAFADRFSTLLGQASDVALAVADGDLSQRLPVRGSDEIATLATSFNRMVEAMDAARDEISTEVEVRKRAEHHARDAAKAKSEFLASMSHEFRTPLNGILGYTQILLMDKSLPEKTLQAISSMRRSGENLLELINDVLDLSKIEASRMTIQISHFYLHDLIDSIREVYEGHARMKGIEFRTVLDAGLPESVSGDEGRLRQILVNLISNAIKFTDQGFVELHVSIHSSELIRFAIQDSGIGVSAAQIDQITLPFHQIGHRDRKAQGTGLGLSISSRLLQMMHSELKIESEPEKGSLFWFELPHQPQLERKMVLSPEEILGYKGRKQTILVVDDSRENRSVLLPLLRKTGFDVIEANSGAVAISDCLRLPPDLILMDYYMPGMTGVEATRSIHEMFRRDLKDPPPVIMTTGGGTAEERAAAEQAGCVEFAVKPIRFADLLRLLQLHLHLHWIYRENAKDAGARASFSEQHTEGIALVTRSQVAQPSITAPPPETLGGLLELARAGNIRPLRKALGDLQKEGLYNDFATFLQNLCRSYQVNRIVEFLEKQLDPPAANNDLQEDADAHP